MIYLGKIIGSEVFNLGKKVARVCPIRQKNVVCDGFCKVAFASEVDGHTEVWVCPVYEKSLDKALNR